jgi:hypothetical protein
LLPVLTRVLLDEGFRTSSQYSDRLRGKVLGCVVNLTYELTLEDKALIQALQLFAVASNPVLARLAILGLGNMNLGNVELVYQRMQGQETPVVEACVFFFSQFYGHPYAKRHVPRGLLEFVGSTLTAFAQDEFDLKQHENLVLDSLKLMRALV